MTALQRAPGETAACCKEQKKTPSPWKQVPGAAGAAAPSHSSQPCGVGRVPLPHCRVTSGYKVQVQAWSEAGCTGAASADTLAAVHSARVLRPSFPAELFIPSICVPLSLWNGTREVRERTPPSCRPADSEPPRSVQVSFPPAFPAPRRLPVRPPVSSG